MRNKEELFNMVVNYKTSNYPHGAYDRGIHKPHLPFRSAINIEKLPFMYDLINQRTQLEGDVAEVGVFRGGVGILLGDMLPNKNIYLFDTFEGIPEVCEKDNFHIVKDFDDVDYEEVKETLSEWSNIKVYKGFFPNEQSNQLLSNKKFSIVHIDTDTYNSYIDCLEFFYPRMVPNGLILLDDYNESSCEGATLATNEFMINKPENIQNSERQYYIIKQ
jgi:O-methyltransferase